jgi:alpha-L-fucosidase 2
MKNPCRYLANIILPLLLLYTDVKAQKDISAYDVIWTSQSENSYGSMPIGNGDIGANVWVTKDGILHILLSKTDAQSEIGRLLKIGRVDIQLQPNLLVSETFKQQLYVYDGMLVIEATDKNNTIRINCWVDANQPVVHIQGSSSNAIDIQATHILWRKTSRLLTGNERHSAYGVGFRPEPFSSEVDTTLKSN